MLHQLPSPKTKKAKIQIGRGIGSKRGGHTSTRGTKGQRSRSGYSLPRPGFEGGQMPLSRRLPRLRGYARSSSRGHRGYFRSKEQNYNLQLSEVAAAVKDGKVTESSLREAGLVTSKTKQPVIKILFDKEIEQKLEIAGIKVSARVKAAVEKAGGIINS